MYTYILYKDLIPSFLYMIPSYKSEASASPQDQVHTTVGIDHIADMSRLRPKRRILKRLLHLPMPEPPQITAIRVGRAV
jgi:hypothetical protein